MLPARVRAKVAVHPSTWKECHRRRQGPDVSKVPGIKERVVGCGVKWSNVDVICSGGQRCAHFGNVVPVDLAGV
eukprot:5787204-Pyramimonas_sp.AAC.1